MARSDIEQLQGDASPDMAGIEFRPVMADEEVRRYLVTLDALIGDRNITGRELARRLGWAQGTLTRLLRGDRELRLEQLLAILKALEVEPLAFYRAVYAGKPLAERLIEGLGGPAVSPVLVPPMMTEEDFSRRVQEALRQALKAQQGK
jgi:transcriptional regulator with XRE-family HTH domain